MEKVAGIVMVSTCGFKETLMLDATTFFRSDHSDRQRTVIMHWCRRAAPCTLDYGQKQVTTIVSALTSHSYPGISRKKSETPRLFLTSSAFARDVGTYRLLNRDTPFAVLPRDRDIRMHRRLYERCQE